MASSSSFDVLGTTNAFFDKVNVAIKMPRSSMIGAKYLIIWVDHNPTSSEMTKAMKKDVIPTVSTANKIS